MNWKIPTASTVWDGALIILGLVLVAFKKELLDWFTGRLRKCHAWLSKWSANRDFVRQVTQKEVDEILGSGLEGIEMSLSFLLDEYMADRVTITEYLPQADGGALVTCLVQARHEAINSVRNLQHTPISAALHHEILLIETMHNRYRFVANAPQSDIAVLRTALKATGAQAAYYQIVSQPLEKPLRLLSISWRHPHELSPSQLHLLHFSGILCSNTLSNLDKWKPTLPS